jgi:hypothetical protein
LIFGKKISEYVAFQKWFIVAALVVGFVKLAMSLGGVPNATLKWLPVNAVVFAGVLYAGVKVYTSGFGSYRQILPLGFLNIVPLHAAAVTGILLTIAGYPNIFTAPEYGGEINQWLHALAHLTAGMIVGPLVLWAVGSLVMKVTKLIVRRPAVA